MQREGVRAGPRYPSLCFPLGAACPIPLPHLMALNTQRQLQVTTRKHDASLTSVRLLFCRTALSGQPDSGALDFLEHLLLISISKHSS